MKKKEDKKEPKKRVKRALTVKNLLSKTYDFLELEGEWKEAFGRPESAGNWIVYGLSANGKTSFTVALIRMLAGLGKRTLLMSIEEKDASTLQRAAIRAGWDEVGENIQIILPEEYADLEARLKLQRSPDVVIIDSVQRFKMRVSQYFDLQAKFPQKLFIWISHVDNKKQPQGNTAVEINRDASLKIWVEGFRAISKGRYSGEKGYYTIWAEGADKYWTEKIQ